MKKRKKKSKKGTHSPFNVNKETVNIIDVIKMYNTNVTNARANLYNLLKRAIDDSEVINISTKHGNAVIISESDYNSLLETLYLSADPVYKQSLVDGKNTPVFEFFDIKVKAYRK